uniref:Ig-like domain-containing protein n=2 Tax=Oreochromis aureus TaxID=47969 RepID=A0A668W0C4_OREAU
MSCKWINQKMLIILYILLSVRVGICTDDLFFETKSLVVGDYVTLKCPCRTAEYKETMYWIRIVSGSSAEFLGGTFTFDYNGVNNTPHITAKQEPGTFILEISKVNLSDIGLYYCIKVRQLAMTFLKGTFLTIEELEPDITDIFQMPPSDHVYQGDPVALQCSLLINTEKKTCSGNHSVYWFRAGTDESQPSLIYAHGNTGDECNKSAEDPSQYKCDYSFSKNVSTADAGSYYCAVATCGQIIFGNGTKLNIKGPSTWDLQKANTVLFLLSAALATSLIVIAYLIKKLSVCCPDTDLGTTSGNHENQERGENSMVYSAATFTIKKSGKLVRRNEKTEEEATVYSDISASAVK